MGNFIDSLSTEQKNNINVIISTALKSGITNPISIAGALAIVSKESGFVPKNENLNYSAKRLQEVFGISAERASKIAGNPQAIGDAIYGGKYGNAKNEGYKFRGRGLNQLTFKGNYEKYKGLIGEDIVSDPERVNNISTAAKILIAYNKNNINALKKSGKLSSYGATDINGFKDTKNAVFAHYHITAGAGLSVNKIKNLERNDSLGGMTKALARVDELYDYVKKFDPKSFPNSIQENTPQSGLSPNESQQTSEQQTPTPTPPPPDPKLDGQITLEKVSGPGNLMGQITSEVIFGQITFSDIQFDEPGTYVLRAIPSNSNVETLEFTVLVSANDNPKSTEKPVEEVQGKRSIITQIDPVRLKIAPITFPVQTTAEPENAEALSQIGLTPFVWYNGFQIKESSLNKLQIYYDEFVPCCLVKFSDLLGIIAKQGMPLSDATFDVFLNSNSSVLKSIHLRFKILDFQQNPDKSYTMTGTLDLKDFYKVNYKSYKGTSFEVMRKIAEELELGYNSNIDNTSDSMTWINTGAKYKDFLNKIIQHSYIGDTSFIQAYIDFYYGLNLVDLEKEWNRDCNNDLGITTGGLTIADENKKDEKTNLAPLILINDLSLHYSNLYFENYRVQNNATNKSVSSGQFTTTKYYDIGTKQFLIFDIDSATTQSNDKVILKGKPTDSEELKTNYTTVFGGKVDLSNVHKNYLYAEVLNKRNLIDISKIVVTFEMPNANFNLYKFQKVRIQFINPAPSIIEEDFNQKRISGDWMIIDIAFLWNGKKMVQIVKAVRRELEKIEEEKNQPVENQQPVKEGNVNQLVEETPPNSIYKIDEIYIIQGSDGTQYELTVKEILDNGNEISGWLWEIEK